MNRWERGSSGSRPAGHVGGRLRLCFGAPAPSLAIPLTLGVIATPADWKAVTALSRQLAAYITEVVIVLDSVRCGQVTSQELQRVVAVPVQIIAHPLNGDFAAQRNRVQLAASSPWVLHLDTDERLTQGALRRLPSLLQQGRRCGWDAIALPRQNIVDGVVSSLYPDVQYRLVRKSMQFVSKVHEHPDLTGRSSFLALDADILHSIDSDRLARRERTYEAIAAGAGRPHDTALLRAALELSVRRAA